MRRGLTQQLLASAVGVTAQAVSKWERGENAPDLFAMPPLAAMLNTSVDMLLDHERRTIRQIDGSVLFAATEDAVSPWVERFRCGEPQQIQIKGRRIPL